jgi:phosphatidate cytidylyltransferase
VTTRTIAGVAAFVVVLGVTYFGGAPFVLLAIAGALFGGYEFYWMLGQGNYRPVMAIGLIWIAFLILNGWLPQSFPLNTVITVGFIATLIKCLTIQDEPLSAFLSTSAVALYVGVMLSQGVALRFLDFGFWWVLLAFLITFGNDTIAYFVGVTFGKHKIWPRLSPKKSWEGTVSGWIGAAVIAALFGYISPLALNLGVAALIGLFGAVLGFFGDLSISMVKRQVGVKDTGHFLPGHGGMLDRLDSLIFVVPFVYQVALLLQYLQ